MTSGSLSPVAAAQALRRRSAAVTAALLAPAYGWLTVAVFLPLLAMLVFSFLKRTPFGSKLPLEFTIANYLAFETRPYLFDVAWASIELGLLTTLFCALIGLPAALVLAKVTQGRFRQVLFLLTILPFWTNGLVRVFSWTMLLREGGILDSLYHLVRPGGSISFLYSFPAIVVGLVHAYLPYMILTCYLAVAAIEDDLIDAARSLGARAPVVFTTIILPAALPGLVSGSILIFVPVIGSFMEPRVLGGRIGVTMGTVIEDQFTSAYNWPLGAALSFTMLAVVLMIFALSSGVLRRRMAWQA